MTDLTRRIDPRSFPILGMLGALACGPIAPQDPDGGSETSTGTGTGTNPTTTPGTTPTTDPTGSTDPTDPTRPTTTGTDPECSDDGDCDSTYCGYCFEGRCIESPGCCGDYAAVRIAGKWRCSPPPYCYSDDECGFGYVCLDGCVESPAIPLPSCDPPDGNGSAWNLGSAPSAFLMIDIENDLDLDLIAAEPAAGVIEIARNDGAGNFILAGAFGVGPEGSGDLALAAGDLNGDGSPDLAVTRREPDGVLRLLFNDGAVFTVGDPLPITAMPVQVFIADVNGDKANDVLTIHEGGAPLGVLLGDNTGKLAPEQPGTPDLLNARGWVGDVTNDGTADLLAPLLGGGGFAAWSGGGPLLNPLQFFNAPDAANMTLLTGDLNGLGLPDILLVHPQDNAGAAKLWAGTGTGAWSSGHRTFTTSRPLTGGVLGVLDIGSTRDLIASTGQNNILALLGDGQGGFTCEVPFEIQGLSAPTLLAIHDLDNDLRPDIIAGGLGSTAITVIHPLFF